MDPLEAKKVDVVQLEAQSQQEKTTGSIETELNQNKQTEYQALIEQVEHKRDSALLLYARLMQTEYMAAVKKCDMALRVAIPERAHCAKGSRAQN